MTQHISRVSRRGGAALIGAAIAVAAPVVAAVPAFAADPTQPFAISGDLATVLYPGVGGPLDLTLTNPNDVGLQLVGLTVTVDSVAPAACAISNFAVDQATLAAAPAVLLPAHGAVSLSALGLTTSQLPRVRMVDTGVSQDECQNASLHLVYTGTAIGPNGQSNGGGDNGDGHDHDHGHDGHHHDGDDDGDDNDSNGSGSGTAAAGLPGTGGSGHEGGMTAAGVGLVGAGSVITWMLRRRKGVAE